MGSFCGANSQQTSNATAFTNPATATQQNAIYNEAQRVYGQFSGNPQATVAPLTSGQQSLISYLGGIPGGSAQWAADAAGMTKAGQGYVQDAADQLGATPGYLQQGAAAATAAQAPTSLKDWDPAAYSSPYTDSVVNTTLANFDRNADISNNSRIGDFIKAGNAFGGDRAGVALAEDRRNQSMARGQLESGLRQADFNQASSQAANQQQMDLARQQSDAARMLQSAGTFGSLAGTNTGAGTALGSLGSTQSAIGQNYGNIANQSALTQASTGTQALNAANQVQQTQQSQLNSPWTQLGYLTSNSPGTSTSPTTTTNTYPGQNPMGTVVGGVTAISQLLPLLSDERAKENAEEIGRTHDGQPIYRYNYKGDPRTTIGLMAQDVEQHTPEAVTSIGGLKGVDYNVATKDAVRADGGRMGEGDDVFSRYHRVTGDMRRAQGGEIPRFEDGGRNPPDYFSKPDPNWQPGRSDNSFLGGLLRNNATFQAGIGMLAGSGKRDQFGLPMSPMAQIGQGLQYGTDQAKQRDEMEQKRYMEERRLWEEKARLAQRLAHEAQIAQGKVMGPDGRLVDTLAARKLPAEIESLSAHGEQAQRRKAEYEKTLAFQEWQRGELQKIAEKEALGALNPQEAATLRSSVLSQAPPRNPYPEPVKRGTWVPGQGVKMGQ